MSFNTLVGFGDIPVEICSNCWLPSLDYIPCVCHHHCWIT